MERAVYDRMAELDSTHWWFTARRRILRELIARVVKPPKRARILELGCGTGHNLAMLSEFGAVEGSELDDAARALAASRFGKPIRKVRLPDLSAFKAGHYDLIALLDVLEHVEDDDGLLAAIRGRLKPGGALLLTVPANPWMWSEHDRAHHHHRRYRKAGLARLARAAGYDIQLLSPFNTLLFPAVAAARAAGKLFGSKAGDDSLPGAAVNRALSAIFGFERRIIGRVPLPFGVSLAGVLRRPRPAA